MRMRPYYADAVFTFRLQTGVAWLDCNADLSEAYADLQAALMRDGLDFTYTDPGGVDVEGQVLVVTAPVPCGDMPAEAEVPGLVAWMASATPKPGVDWALGEVLAGWLAAVPVVSGDLTWMVGLQSLWARQTGVGDPGWLWPDPDAVTGNAPIV